MVIGDSFFEKGMNAEIMKGPQQYSSIQITTHGQVLLAILDPQLVLETNYGENFRNFHDFWINKGQFLIKIW